METGGGGRDDEPPDPKKNPIPTRDDVDVDDDEEDDDDDDCTDPPSYSDLHLRCGWARKNTRKYLTGRAQLHGVIYVIKPINRPYMYIIY